jgi:signal transduction histidine kinase
MIQIVKVFAALLLVLAGAAVAGETRGTPEEARAMVARAIAAYDTQGKSAFPAMTTPGTEFRDRDLYVFVAGPDNVTVAHGLDASLIGRDLAQILDSAGKAFGKEIIDKADEKGVWVDYAWRDPLTGKDIQKSSWVVRHDGYIFGCGIYKP